MSNSIKLTDAKIKSLKPLEKGQAEYSDSQVPGLRIRIGTTGVKSFCMRKRHKGKIKNVTLGRYGPSYTLAQARREARAMISDIEITGSAQVLPKGQAKTIESLFPAFERAKSGNRTINETKRIFRRDILPALGHRSAEAVTRSEITRFIDTIEKPIMARAVLAQLSSFYGWALPRLDNLDFNPCLHAGKPPKSKAKTRFLTDPEIRALWHCLASEGVPWGAGIKLLLLTGQRRNEVFSADRREFDLAARLWTIPAERAKNGVAHIVPLSRAAIEIIEALPIPDDTTKLFASRSKANTGPSGFSRTLERLIENMDARLGRTDSERWTLHDIRRTVATCLQRLSVRLEVTEAILNHISGSKGGIAGVYQRHDWAQEKRAALDAWADQLERIVKDQDVSNVVTFNG